MTTTTTSRHVLLTGPPGIGKTTLIKKVCDALKNDNIPINGFYTEELRNESNRRSGFDVVGLNGKREKLSRTTEYLQPGDPTNCKVGQYYVFPQTFEKFVLPFFEMKNDTVLIVDEIGKMELFSKKFEAKVKTVFARPDISILATIPISRGASIPLVETLSKNPDCYLITVHNNNRNNLVQEITSYLKS